MEERNDKLVYQEEKELIRLIKKGNDKAFSNLIGMYQKKIFRLAFGFFHDRDDALEIVQESFLRIYQKISSFREEIHFRNWLYRMVLNLCIDYYRKYKKRTSQVKEEYQVIFEKFSEINGSPEEALDMLKFKENLKKSMSHLPKRQKQIFVLKHYGHYQYKEIADILDISTGCVKSLHHRSIHRLKNELSNKR